MADERDPVERPQEGEQTHDPLRRRDVKRMHPAERAILDAVLAVERVGADPRLTDAVMRLGEAQEAVADYVDGVVRPATPHGVTDELDDLLDRLVDGERQFRTSGNEVAADLLAETISALRARPPVEPEREPVRLKLQRVRDWLKYAANSDGGIVAEIDHVLAYARSPGAETGGGVAFWRDSYRILADAVEEHLSAFIIDDDVAEMAIYEAAIKEAGKVIASRSPGGTETRELRCMKCGIEHEVWSARSDLWNAAIRRPDGSDRWPFLCPTCFMREARVNGEGGIFFVTLAEGNPEAEGSPGGETPDDWAVNIPSVWDPSIHNVPGEITVTIPDGETLTFYASASPGGEGELDDAMKRLAEFRHGDTCYDTILRGVERWKRHHFDPLERKGWETLASAITDEIRDFFARVSAPPEPDTEDDHG